MNTVTTPDTYWAAAELALIDTTESFWGHTPNEINEVIHVEIDPWIGYWGSGHGDNNPADLTNDERSLLFCFLACAKETGDL